MKSTSLPNRGMALLLRKVLTSGEQFKTLTAADLLSCLFAGALSQGTLFGMLKPFGMAFYAAFPGAVPIRALMLAAILAGNLIGGGLQEALKQTTVILFFEWLKKLFFRKGKEPDLITNACIAGAATAVIGLFILFLSGQLAQAFIILLMETALACMVTAMFSITLQGRKPALKDRFAGQKNMEYFGALVMGGAFLLGVSGISFPGVSLERILAGLGLLMLTRHFGPGFGACAGAVSGLALAAAYPHLLPSLIGIYAISGMTAGMLQKSKFAAGLSFLMVQILFYLTAKDTVLILPDMLIPVLLFLVLPDLKAGKLMVLRSFIAKEPMEANGRVRKLVSERLESISTALCRLGHTVDRQLKSRSEPKGDLSGAVMEQLTQQVCSACRKSSTCWESKLFFTYKTLGALIDSLQRHPAEPDREAEKELSRFCVKSGTVMDALLRIIEIKRVDRVWQSAVIETQSAIPGQIFGVSELLQKLSAELLQEAEAFDEEEGKIIKALRKNSYPVHDVEVIRGPNGKFTAVISLEECRGFRNCPGEITVIVSQILGVQMLAQEGSCTKSRGNCTVMLKEKEVMGITTGVARLKKGKAKVSGDSFTFFKTREGKYIAAISDGMGSGRDANRLSETAIGLFEQLVDCGLSIRLALSFVNMMIEVTSPEKYATMDISAVDLYTGDTEFYKMGAMPSLVINGRNLDYIQINNLPAGLHQGNPVSYEKRRILDGEFIIMMTDGVYDRLSGGNEKTLLEKVVNLKNTLNPQELAEHLLHSASGNTDEVSDDMTVLVAKLWRKAG